MYWSESPTDSDTYRVSDAVIDMSFKIVCARLPVDHAWPLCSAIHAVLPWLPAENQAGIHLVHGAESGNGWYRPDDDDYLILPKRTRLSIRIPSRRRSDIIALSGCTLDVDDCRIKTGDAHEKPLVPCTIVFSRHVAVPDDVDENDFLGHVSDQLQSLGVKARKIMCGRMHSIKSPDGPIPVRSILVADLDISDSVVLQQNGIGALQAFGLGLFVPHKGIDAIYSKHDSQSDRQTGTPTDF
ncbi:MAG: hypothetical protein DHS20C01_19500 [marine bacterium B5-7]|nr:MAG: hypothetical protein DHS20C01_19500 [marine bacterium B5-7]